MVQDYFKKKSIIKKQPRSIVIQRILAFSKYYSITKEQYDESRKQV